MSTFAQDILQWLETESPRAQRAERAQPGAAIGSARSASSARGIRNENASSVPVEFGGDADAQYVFFERLGIAADLNMAIDAGSPAWCIARDDARAALPIRQREFARADDLAAIVSGVLGVKVRHEVRPVGQLFSGEPDWDRFYPSFKKSTTGGAP